MAEIKTPEGVINIDDEKSVEVINKILEAKAKAEADLEPVRKKLNETVEESKGRKATIAEKTALIEQLQKEKTEIEAKATETEKLAGELKALKEKDTGALSEIIKKKEEELEALKKETSTLKTEHELSKSELNSLKEYQKTVQEKETAKRNSLMEEVKNLAEARPEILKLAEAIKGNDELEILINEFSRKPGNYNTRIPGKTNTGDNPPDPSQPGYLMAMHKWNQKHKK